MVSFSRYFTVCITYQPPLIVIYILPTNTTNKQFVVFDGNIYITTNMSFLCYNFKVKVYFKFSLYHFPTSATKNKISLL